VHYYVHKPVSLKHLDIQVMKIFIFVFLDFLDDITQSNANLDQITIFFIKSLRVYRVLKIYITNEILEIIFLKKEKEKKDKI